MKTKDVNNWLNPWPIELDKKSKWEFKIVELDKVLKWKNYNKITNLGRISFKEIAQLQLKNDSVAGIQDHYIKRLYQNWATIATDLTIIAIKKNKDIIVIDGNHRMGALALAKQLRTNLKITHVGVVLEKVIRSAPNNVLIKSATSIEKKQKKNKKK